MISSETININGKEFTRTFSTEGAVLRCGKKRYIEAVDPVGKQKVYFEEGVENHEEEQEAE